MFTTVGLITETAVDCCDHEHGTRDEAQECLLKHSGEMRKSGRVSLRQVVEVESLDAFYDEIDLM